VLSRDEGQASALVRLVLFDIDGTLLSASGVSGRALGDALLEVFGDAGPIAAYDFSGRTDLQIVRELLEAAGWHPDEVHALRPRALERYAELLRQRLRPEHVKAKPGAVQLVQALAGRHDVSLGLLTGNVEGGARLKLDPLGLNPHFRFGAYGSDHEDRSHLAALAVERAHAITGRRFAGHEVVVVGDSVHDVTCGRPLGARSLAVATGFTTRAQLAGAGADVLLDDLSDTEAVIRAILHEE
jgi:phosphoglycolate phosphatase